MPPAASPDCGTACQSTGAAATAAGACFSPCGRYRWWLRRRWPRGRGRLLFIGLNPSRADGHRDDPSLRRLTGFAQAWGFAELEVLNLFARVAVRPTQLRQLSDPCGADNDTWLAERLERQRQLWAAEAAAPVWLGWGNHGGRGGRDQQVLELVWQWGCRPAWLGLTTSGQPRHPLYVAARTPLLLAGPSWAERRHAPLPSWPVSPVATPFT